MWIKKVFTSVYFRVVVASLIPPLGLIVLSSHQISQIATFNELTFFDEIIFLAATFSIVFARLGAGLGTLLKKIPKAKFIPR
jgi:hypothetical protein